MNLKPEQLGAHLQRGLAPIYVISGAEPLLVQEAADAVRTAARERGYTDREVLQVAAGFDWDGLLQSAASPSLFAERRILELRLAAAKPGEAGARALLAYAARPAEDVLLMVVCGKLEKDSRQSRWLSALEQAGVAVQVWPVSPQALPQWIAARMRQRGLQPTADAVALLAGRVEGNLLAAAREVDKLVLLHEGGAIDAAAVAAAVSDSARFDVFALVDAALTGDAARSLRILDGLRAEGVEAVLVVWALARELRLVAGVAFAQSRGASPERALQAAKVWQQRQAVIGAAVRRAASGPAPWRALLLHCARVDRMVKGVEAGSPWDELLQLVLKMAHLSAGRAAEHDTRRTAHRAPSRSQNRSA